jgi:Preprotein translocase subunit Sec66
MRRAIRAIPILLSLQNEGNSIERLYKRGMLTDDMHFKVKNLKAFVDQELQFEADDLVEGWSQHIWPQAMQFHTVNMLLSINHIFYLFLFSKMRSSKCTSVNDHLCLILSVIVLHMSN